MLESAFRVAHKTYIHTVKVMKKMKPAFVVLAEAGGDAKKHIVVSIAKIWCNNPQMMLVTINLFFMYVVVSPWVLYVFFSYIFFQKIISVGVFSFTFNKLLLPLLK